MHPDVVDLREFYEGPLGRLTQRMVRRRLAEMWPSLRGESVLGLGYGAPYLRPFLEHAARVVVAMPAEQGAVRWPREGPNATVLTLETMLPFENEFFERVVIAHGLEHASAAQPYLREVWRVLAPAGRLIVVAPNRTGLWARAEATPFGHGRPFSREQLKRTLNDALFAPTAWEPALFAPPFAWRHLLGSAAAWERVGARWWPRFAGVTLVEATKRVYAQTPRLRAERARPRLVVAPPLGRPASAREGTPAI